MSKSNLETNNIELFEVEELESRFEMSKWIPIDVIYHPCDCPPEDDGGTGE